MLTVLRRIPHNLDPSVMNPVHLTSYCYGPWVTMQGRTLWPSVMFAVISALLHFVSEGIPRCRAPHRELEHIVLFRFLLLRILTPCPCIPRHRTLETLRQRIHLRLASLAGFKATMKEPNCSRGMFYRYQLFQKLRMTVLF